MGSTKHLIRLRNDIDDLVNESFRLKHGTTLSTDDILKEVKRRLPKQIASAEADLTDIALKRLIDSVGRRKAGRRNGLEERDLFGEYSNIPQIVTIGEKKRKRMANLSISEALNYLETHSPKAVSVQHEAMKRLVADCLPFKSSDDDTIGVLLARRKLSLTDNPKSAFSWKSTSPMNSTSKANQEESVLVR